LSLSEEWIMRLPFVKMHGAGNDFLLVAGDHWPAGGLQEREIAGLCHRRTGVGADGLIVASAPDPGDDVDFAMTYYNSDGREAEMCGNGARCAAAFAHARGMTGASCRFRTRAGVVDAEIAGGEVVVTLPPWRDLQCDLTVPGSPFAQHHACNTGVPHLNVPVADVDAVEVSAAGPPLRHHELFAPAGTNVDWVSRSDSAGAWHLRTYERGVESETLACGTGAAAAAVVLVRRGLATSPVELLTRGGDRLEVTVMEENNGLRLRGPAVTVFAGEAYLDNRPD
jgi:diaminopimelate epimerase